MSQRMPVATKIAVDEGEWFRKYEALSESSHHHVLLESGRDGRYSIMAIHPEAILTGKDGQLSIQSGAGEETLQGDPLLLMKDWLVRYQMKKDDRLPPFQGGAIGFISYDYNRYIEKLPELAKDDLNLPDLHFYVFETVYVYDHERTELWIIGSAKEGMESFEQERVEALAIQWGELGEVKPKEFVPTVFEPPFQVSLSESEFQQAARDVQKYIANGDVFQVNLSVRQSKPLLTHPMDIYKQLRVLNPSPYMAYMESPDWQIVSGSPELLIKKSDHELHTRPIAGTRSRGKTPEEDQALSEELLGSVKERAEHVMLVDLERNDLGKVSEYGSVRVSELMVIERYSHVMHIVSHVLGQMREGQTEYDCIRATFPGGTITGAPKVRTMEIIEELEPTRRNIYTGSIGWIGFNGDMELNIAIRTMVAKDGWAHVQAGAGIVIDSNPKHEYKESLKKGAALWRAKELSEAEKNLDEVSFR